MGGRIKFPFLLTLVVVWVGMKVLGVSMSPADIGGLIMLFAAIVAGFLEVYKGADVGLRTFKYELFIAEVLLIGVSMFFCLYLIPRGAVQITDVVIAGMVLADAWLSPTVAYATALRNFAANTDSN